MKSWLPRGHYWCWESDQIDKYWHWWWWRRQEQEVAQPVLLKTGKRLLG